MQFSSVLHYLFPFSFTVHDFILSYIFFRNVIPVTFPRWSSTDTQQIVGDVTRLNVVVPRQATTW
jgi:hypothetical protein